METDFDITPMQDALHRLQKVCEGHPEIVQRLLAAINAGERLEGIHVRDGHAEVGPSDFLRGFFLLAEVVN